MNFLIAGGLRTDYLITQAGRVHAGLPGGNALFAAAGAVIWSDPGDSVAPWARYGDNFPGKWLANLSELGLDNRALIAIPGEQDHRTFFAYTPDGQRVDTNPEAHFARVGHPLPEELRSYIHSTPRQDDADDFEPLAVRPLDWPDEMGNVTAVHLAPLPLATHLHLPPLLRENGVELITVDPGERYMVPGRLSFIKAVLAQVDVFLPSDMEIRSLFGESVSLKEAARQLHSWGVPLVVIKIGARGVLLFDGHTGSEYHLLPYHPPNDPRVVDTTGAGDAFCGGFMIGLSKTGDLLQSLNMGLVSASMVIEGHGALYALNADRDESAKRLQVLDTRLKSA